VRSPNMAKYVHNYELSFVFGLQSSRDVDEGQHPGERPISECSGKGAGSSNRGTHPRAASTAGEKLVFWGPSAPASRSPGIVPVPILTARFPFYYGTFICED